MIVAILKVLPQSVESINMMRLRTYIQILTVLAAVACNNDAQLNGSGKAGAGSKPVAPQTAPPPAPPASNPPSPAPSTQTTPTAPTPPSSDPVDPDQIRGDDLALVSGFYDSPNWGKMLIEIDGDKIYGTYGFRFGTHQGTIDLETGVASVVWCEGAAETGARPYRGIAQFVFQLGDANAYRLKGKWKPGAAESTAWIEDWDVTKVDAAAPAELIERMGRKGSPVFCDQP